MPPIKLHLIANNGDATTLCGRDAAAVGGLPYHAVMRSPSDTPSDAYCRICRNALDLQEERRIYQENRVYNATYARHQYLPVDAELLTVAQAAEVMGLSVARVRVLAASNRLPGTYRLGRDWAIPRASAEAHVSGPAGNPAWRRPDVSPVNPANDVKP